MDILIAQLMKIAVSMTGYPAPDALPPIYTLSAQHMPCACIGATLYSREVLSYGHPVTLPVRVFLRDDVDPHGTFGSSVLLHELVHVLQASEGPARFGSPVWHAREQEAHRIQKRYLMRNGLALPGLFGLGPDKD